MCRPHRTSITATDVSSAASNNAGMMRNSGGRSTSAATVRSMSPPAMDASTSERFIAACMSLRPAMSPPSITRTRTSALFRFAVSVRRFSSPFRLASSARLFRASSNAIQLTAASARLHALNGPQPSLPLGLSTFSTVRAHLKRAGANGRTNGKRRMEKASRKGEPKERTEKANRKSEPKEPTERANISLHHRKTAPEQTAPGPFPLWCVLRAISSGAPLRS